MKVLIADDEPFVLEGLTQLLSNNVPEANEILTADNGAAALSLCEQTGPPDLLITDVCMPRVGGIELGQAVRQLYPDCRIVIISGYEDFEAARSAIEVGALRYMLKPIVHKEMIDYVKSIAAQLQAQRQSQEEAQSRQIENLLVELHNHMLQDVPFTGAERIAQEQGAYCVVRFVAVGGSLAEDSPEPVRSALRRLCAKREQAVYVVSATQAEAVLLICAFTEQDKAWIEELLEAMGAVAGYPIAAGAGCRCRLLSQAYLSYRTAGMAMGSAYLYGGSMARYYDSEAEEMEREQAGGSLETLLAIRQDTRRMIDFCALRSSAEQTVYCIHTFMARLERTGCPLSVQRLMCADLAADLAEEIYVADAGMAQELRIYFDMDLYVRCANFAQLRRLMDQFAKLCISLLTRASSSRGNRLIQSIRAEVQADLKNASLSRVADALNMSPTYISLVFKEKTKQNFKDYLLQCRMSRARQLLQRGEAVHTVARQLGYEDVEHFSRRFRESCGMSPAAYRRNAGEGAADSSVERRTPDA